MPPPEADDGSSPARPPTSLPRRKRGGTGTTRRIIDLAWPAIITNLLQSATGLLSVAIVGRALGPSSVAAVGIGMRVFFLQQVVLMAVTTGTTAMVARAWGAGDREEAERVTRTSLWLCIVLALALTVPSIALADPLAGVFDLEPETHALTATYIRWMCASGGFLAINLVIGTALRAAGDTRTPLWIGAATMAVNVVALYGLVFGGFGLPVLGIRGVAIANGFAFLFGAVLSVALWLRGSLVVRYGPPGGDFARPRVRQLVRIGAPTGFEQGAFQFGFIAFVWLVALYGTEANAAYQIGVQILSFAFLVGFGFSIAASTLVGQHLGAGDPEGAATAGWRAVVLAIAVNSLFGAGIIAFAEPLAALTIDDPEVIRLTVVFIYVLGSVQPLMAVEFTLGGALRGAGDTRFPLFATLAGMLGVRITTAAWMAWQGWSVEWIYASLIADYVLKGAMLVWRFRSGRWKTAIASPPAPESEATHLDGGPRAAER